MMQLHDQVHSARHASRTAKNHSAEIAVQYHETEQDLGDEQQHSQHLQITGLDAWPQLQDLQRQYQKQLAAMGQTKLQQLDQERQQADQLSAAEARKATELTAEIATKQQQHFSARLTMAQAILTCHQMAGSNAAKIAQVQQ